MLGALVRQLLNDLADDLLARAPFLGQELGEHVPQLAAHEVTGRHLVEGQAQRGDLPGEVLGVLQVRLGALAVLLGGDPVAVILAVLGQ